MLFLLTCAITACILLRTMLNDIAEQNDRDVALRRGPKPQAPAYGRIDASRIRAERMPDIMAAHLAVLRRANAAALSHLADGVPLDTGTLRRTQPFNCLRCGHVGFSPGNDCGCQRAT